MSQNQTPVAVCSPQAHASSGPGTGPCEACDRPRCNGTTRTGRCRKQPMKGATVCRTHGGSAPQVKAAAAQRIERRKAVLAAETFGLAREVDPHTALLEELHRTAGAVEWLSAVVADIKKNQITWSQTRRKTGGEDYGVTYEAGTNAWVAEWRAERKQLVDVSKACIAVGIEERRVRLAEDAGRQLAAIVRAVLERLELTDSQRATSLIVVPEEFRRAAGELGPTPTTSTPILGDPT